MKNHLVSVAAAVPRLRVGDINFNTKQITEMIASLPDCGLVVFPELSIRTENKNVLCLRLGLREIRVNGIQSAFCKRRE